MIRTLLIGGAAIAIGYTAGALSGYRAAVRDYVENDARQLESMADSMYSQYNEALPEEVEAVMNGGLDERETTANAESSDDSRAFQ